MRTNEDGPTVEGTSFDENSVFGTGDRVVVTRVWNLPSNSYSASRAATDWTRESWRVRYVTRLLAVVKFQPMDPGEADQILGTRHRAVVAHYLAQICGGIEARQARHVIGRLDAPAYSSTPPSRTTIGKTCPGATTIRPLRASSRPASMGASLVLRDHILSCPRAPFVVISRPRRRAPRA